MSNIEFSSMPTKVGNGWAGKWEGVASLDIDDTTGGAYVEQIVLVNDAKGTPDVTLRRPKSLGSKEFNDVLFLRIEDAILHWYADEVAGIESDNERKDCGCGHLQHERL